MEPVLYLGDGPALDRCGTCLAFFATIETLQRLAQYRMSRPPSPTEQGGPSWVERLVARLTSRG
jgi:hypothetical protein